LAQLQQLYEQGLLSEANYRAALVGLGVDPDAVAGGPTYHVHIESASGLAIGDGAQVGTEPGAGPPALDEETTLGRYLRHVVEANRRLQLQGIRSAGRLVSIGLEEVYVTLTATERRTVAAEEAWVDEMAQLAPGEVERMARLGAERPRETVTQVKVKVQEALAAHPRLVVLGDPGCGKTTLLRYLALTYARDLLGEGGLVARRLELSEQRLPILLPLRDFARYLEANHPDPSTDGPKLLLDYLRTYFTHQDIALPERFFADRLLRGECAVLLDGVDEVADLITRHRVARIIERFTIAYPDNRYVVTSRIVGYTGSAWLGEARPTSSALSPTGTAPWRWPWPAARRLTRSKRRVARARRCWGPSGAASGCGNWPSTRCC
jgi:hypothetical protein